MVRQHKTPCFTWGKMPIVMHRELFAHMIKVQLRAPIEWPSMTLYRSVVVIAWMCWCHVVYHRDI